MSPGGQPLADFGNRLLAWLIDGAIVTVVALVVTLPVFFVVFFAVLQPDIEAATVDDSAVPWRFVVVLLLLEVGIFLFSLALSYVYYAEIMYRFGGQTPGKRLLNLRVVPIDPAARLTRGMAARRFLIQFVVGGIVPLFSLLDGLWQLWDKPFLQTLHDKAAQTVVVKVSP